MNTNEKGTEDYFREGQRAYYLTAERIENPYDVTSDKWFAWNAGWVSAQNEERAAELKALRKTLDQFKWLKRIFICQVVIWMAVVVFPIFLK